MVNAADIEIPEPQGAEQRAHERFDRQLPVEFEFDGERFGVSSVNVSAGGMFLDVINTPPREAALSLSIRLGVDDDAERLLLQGTVVHLGVGGIGVRFDRVDDFAPEIAKLEAYLLSSAE